MPCAASTAAEEGLLTLREAAQDELVGVIDHRSELCRHDGAVEFHRVPMAFVQVVAGANRCVPAAQFEGPLGVALEADAARRPEERDEREHLASDLEDRDVISE